MAERAVITGTSLADEIAFRLERGILEGEFPPGTHLLQDEICARYGVSRTPVREALRILQAQNLVVVTANRGATVRVPTRDDLVEVYAVRAQLEGYACELATLNGDAELAESLDEAQEVIESVYGSLRAGQHSEEADGKINAQISRGNEAFHEAIFRMAGNEQLRTLCISLQRFFPKDYVWRAFSSAPEVTETLHVIQHREIMDAFRKRDGKRARAAMEEHIALGGKTLITYLDGRGFWDSAAR
jgi:DNA-binding GntR family transcriptional regulator